MCIYYIIYMYAFYLWTWIEREGASLGNGRQQWLAMAMVGN